MHAYLGSSSRVESHISVSCVILFSKKNLEDICPFCGVTNIPVLDFWRHVLWVSKPGWISCLYAFPPACNRLLRFISCATPADLLAPIHVLADRLSPSIGGDLIFNDRACRSTILLTIRPFHLGFSCVTLK